jgi:hypothetical protein
MATQTFLIGLRSEEWSNLFAAGEIRILRTRLIKSSDSSLSIDLPRLFSVSANGKLEDSGQMIIAQLKYDPKKLPPRHPRSVKSDLFIIPLQNFTSFYLVQEKDHQHVTDLVVELGIKIEPNCFDDDWNNWVLEEGVRQRISASQIVLSAMALRKLPSKRSDRFSWEEIATCVLRPSAKFNHNDSILITFLRAKTKLIDLTQEYRKSEAHFISSAAEWSRLHTDKGDTNNDAKFSRKLAKELTRCKEISWSNPNLISNETLKFASQIRRKFKTSFNKELTPASISLYLRHSYQIKNEIFKPEEFKSQISSLLKIDGIKAAVLTCFLVATELGLERTHSYFNVSRDKILNTEMSSTLPSANVLAKSD